MDRESVLVSFQGGVRTIKINRPELKNALNTEVFENITNILNNDALNNDVVVTVLTSVGSFFLSGMELNTNKIVSLDAINGFICAVLDYPKILIAVVQGPAIGIGVTILPLFDVVYASDRAWFSTPFIHLDVTPEAGSSYLFSRIMGRSKAMEMLLLGEKISVEDALNCNLISRIIPHEKIGDVFEELMQFGSLSVTSVKLTKQLINLELKENVRKIIANENDILVANFHSAYFRAAKKLKLRKSKL